MNQPTYHKIQSAFKRDPDNNYKTFIMWAWADEAFGYLKDLEWSATEKVDGTNTRIHFDDGTYTVGGRTERAELHKDLVTHLNSVGDKASSDFDGLTLYGEGYGAGIQKGGGNYRQDKGFILFDVMVTDSNLWLDRQDIEDIAATLDLPIVEQVWGGTLEDAVFWYLEGKVVDSRIKSAEAEGWVLRPHVELKNRRGQRIITKLKVTDFPEERAS